MNKYNIVAGHWILNENLKHVYSRVVKGRIHDLGVASLYHFMKYPLFFVWRLTLKIDEVFIRLSVFLYVIFL